MSKTHLFEHEAMKTTFTFRILSDDAMKAKTAAKAAIELLEDIELKLNRYEEGSDVWQINHLEDKQSLFVSDECYACLRIALEAHEQTGGLFDVTLGRQIEHQKNDDEGESPDIIGQLMIDPEKPQVHCITAGREVDLGGIGKGFALDCIQKRLQELGIESALLTSGSSTQLAFGPKTWKITLVGDHLEQTIELNNKALSASGTGIQGAHIVAPLAGRGEHSYTRLWLLEDSAAMADAWSTAAMLLTPEELKQLEQTDIQLYVDRPIDK
ncbi:FAD:protein FMN transferase [Coraliomargarita akajimensis]|uniref:FAD:protein FMN transferase n=1 Tax=Coraliomargarita akajimensis (strain DSM 45221 / IAM 15411 / JCM 23193 / KCTC 12865 / 04OKA010-24) TaxID=583355 RepID=D5EQL1_CORAD|nr:FAD:protein FMN transferase [Coraliomargarita akajimensis]ADE55825.1 ApbE family lipoprotein [Coraliomargarita akajimensis DSM 45221]